MQMGIDVRYNEFVYVLFSYSLSRPRARPRVCALHFLFYILFIEDSFYISMSCLGIRISYNGFLFANVEAYFCCDARRVFNASFRDIFTRKHIIAYG